MGEKVNSKISENQNLATVQSEELKNSSGMAYTEIPELTNPSLDVLNQLQANMKMLGDLHQRLHFTIREIKSVIR